MNVDVSDTLTLNGVAVDFTVASLTAALGPPRDDGKLFWDSYGIEARTFGRTLDEISFVLLPWEFDVTSRQYPEHAWTGEILVEGRPLGEAYIRRDGVWGDSYYARAASSRYFVTVAWPHHGQGRVDEASRVTITPVPPRRDDVDPATYALVESSEPVVTFTNWTFKLAVIQILMYMKGELGPRFDIEEFAAVYPARRIDPYWEGECLGIIPEAADWFWRLPVPARLAPLVTSLCLDGGDEVYAQLWPLWDGESDEFTICADSAELDQFPNLTRLTEPGSVTPATLQLVADRGWDIGEDGRELLRRRAATQAWLAAQAGTPQTVEGYCWRCPQRCTVVGPPVLDDDLLMLRVTGACPTCGDVATGRFWPPV